MKPVNNKILVSVNRQQKNSLIVGDVEYHAALNFESNYREKSPVIAVVEEGAEFLRKGDVLLCHHNMFSGSAYFVADNIYSIPFTKVLFAKLYSSGEIHPICGNMICEKIPIIDKFSLPTTDPKKERVYIDRYRVVIPGWTRYKRNDIIFTRPYSGYDIVYNVGGIVKRITKVDSEMVCGVLSKPPSFSITFPKDTGK